MSIDAQGRTHGVKDGKYTLENRPEAVNVNLVDDGEMLGGLRLDGDFNGNARELATMISRAGVRGSVEIDSQDREYGWTRLRVTLASGDQMDVGISGKPYGRISAVTTSVYPSDDHPDFAEAESQSFGGAHSELDIHDSVRHALLQVAATATFRDMFPATPGLELTFIGEQSTFGRDPRLPRPQECGASFTLDGQVEMLATVPAGGIELEVDGVSLDERKPYLLNATCADINARLGLKQPALATQAQTLARAITGVVDLAHNHPFWAANIDESKAGLP